MNINWSALYAHLVVGIIAALAVFTSLSAGQAVTWHDWVAAVSAFFVATGGSASTSGGISLRQIPPIVLNSAASLVGPASSPAAPSSPTAPDGSENGTLSSTPASIPPVPMPTVDNLAPAAPADPAQPPTP